MSANPVVLATAADEDISSEARLVRDALIEQGLETPMVHNGLGERQKYERIKSLMTDVVSTLGLDLEDDSLAETPHRIAKMYVYARGGRPRGLPRRADRAPLRTPVRPRRTSPGP